jgi:hypothetical protein
MALRSSFPSSLSSIALGALGFAALGGCDSTVVGGGGGADPDGAGGGAVVVGSGSPSTTTVTAAAVTTGGANGDGGGDGPTTSSGGPGDLPSEVAGVLVPGEDDHVDFLLANSPQSCGAPLEEPPCASGERWLARIQIPTEDLAVGTYELGGPRIGISVLESFDFCSGFGGRGWDGEPARLTIESIDAAQAVITIEGAYDDVDGTWDVALCAGVTPAPR